MLIGETSLDVKPFVNHLMAYSVSSKLISQSLKFTKTSNYSQIGETYGRFNNKDMTEQTIGRFNISLLLITKDS